MTRWWRRSSTGSSRRGGALLIAGALLLAPASPEPARAQALKLTSLSFPPSAVVGPWVSYRVRAQTRSRPVRTYTQRVAIVARDRYEGREGFWVELKTEGLPSGKRIERGFFQAIGEEEGSPAAPGAPPGSLRLTRYQVLQSNGKLFEFPPERISEARAGGEVSTIELFEYDPSVPPVVENLGPDTLRIGRRVVPALVERTLRAGSDDWTSPGDTTMVNRTLLVQTVWRNEAVPITGLARSLFQLTTERVPATARDSAAIRPPALAPPPLDGGAATVPAARADSVAAGGGISPGAAGPSDSAVSIGSAGSTGSGGPAAPASPPVLSWTDLVLLDLGSDAKPEVTQEAEPLPADAPAGSGGIIR